MPCTGSWQKAATPGDGCVEAVEKVKICYNKIKKWLHTEKIINRKEQGEKGYSNYRFFLHDKQILSGLIIIGIIRW